MTGNMAPCACPCTCSRPSMQPKTESAVLLRRARCLPCSKPEHKALHPVEYSEASSRPLTASPQIPASLKRLDADIAASQREQIHRAALEKWTASLPEKFRHSTTDHPKILERLARIEAGQPGTAGALIFGPVGEGKTFLALGYANLAIERGLVKPNEILFGTEAEMLAAAANSTFGEVEAALRRLASHTHRMVIIDDVGRGTWLREDMRAKVFMLVLDSAWRENRIVVITTNLGVTDLEEYIGAGAMDRLRSMCGYAAISLDDRGMRRHVTEQALAEAEHAISTRPDKRPAR